MSWLEFGDDTALGRNLLERAPPLVATKSTRNWPAEVDMTRLGMTVSAHIGLADTIAATPERCIDMLQICPLLFGTAWEGPRPAARGGIRRGG
jgi:hypothetical protein